MRILVIEDDRSLNRLIVKHMKEAGYAVDTCFDGCEGEYYMTSAEYDCIILDWMLPEKDGVTILKECRMKGMKSPVLMLTAKDSISDRVRGLDSGADDYLIKPFSFEELMARTRALVRRIEGNHENILTCGTLSMDTDSHLVKRDNETISLTAKEYALLHYLMLNKDITLSRSQISEHVWNYDYLDFGSNVVDCYIRYLRNKIDKGFQTSLIHTVRGFGYKLSERED